MFKHTLLGFLLGWSSFAAFGASEPLTCHEVSPQFSGIAGKTDPDVKDIMALGQLGGTLCLTLLDDASVSGRKNN